MDAVSNFLAMGGYAAFVWPALGLTALVLIAMAFASTRQLRANEAALQRAEAAVGDRRQRRGGA